MMDYNTIINDDCLHAMQRLEDNTIDSIVTDPPYGLSFMGKDWDHGVPGEAFWREALRVAKPGAHLLAFGGTRTHHRLMCAIEDAGWEIRDCLGWLYGSGFPKSLNLKGEWQGWGTALKPAWEPIVLARKPLIGTVAQNVLEHGTGALNIDGCRVGTENTLRTNGKTAIWSEGGMNTKQGGSIEGRFPANLIHDGSDEVLALFPKEGRSTKASASGMGGWQKGDYVGGEANSNTRSTCYTDTGSAARFFYCAKASKSERNMGCEGLEEKDTNRYGDFEGTPEHAPKKDVKNTNNHPTVKPLALMRYLCRLVTPPDGVVLDPFCGSGSTLVGALQEGFRYIGIEKDPDYVNIAYARTKHALKEWGRESRQQVLQEVVS